MIVRLPDMRAGLFWFVCCSIFVVLSGPLAVAGEPAARLRHGVVRFSGDLETGRGAERLCSALSDLDDAGLSLIMVEVRGARSRADLLEKALGVVCGLQTRVAVWVDDEGAGRVGPGQVALALAGDLGGLGRGVRVVRDPGDGLEELEPGVGDWAVLGLDLRDRAGRLAASRGLAESWVEALVAPRSSYWLGWLDDGTEGLIDVAAPGARRVVKLSEKGWSFEMEGSRAARLYGLELHHSARSFARAAGAVGRAERVVEIESDLSGEHERCLLLVSRVRAAIGLAEAALDVRSGRRGRGSLSPRDYHRAADRAGELVSDCRKAIAEIADRTDTFPEILRLPAPPDDRAPTEIGGESRSRLASWRDAVRSAETALSRLDDRIAAYRRR